MASSMGLQHKTMRRHSTIQGFVMPTKTFSVRFLLLIGLLSALFVSTAQAAGNEAVTATNSIIGANASDTIGSGGVIALPSGNIVIASPDWNGGMGAVTCLTPAEYQAGNIVVSASNSLTGSKNDDRIGEALSVTVLTNGNYVVESTMWDNGSAFDVGAVTWVNGTTCIPHNETTRNAVVSASNSLVGSTNNDNVGEVTALTNGHYVVRSLNWNNGSAIDAGAATWVNGSTGMHGAVSAANSLVGSTTDDRVGSPIFALANGNYVVVSSSWTNTLYSAPAAGAVTLANGTTGLTGPVTTENSLYGTNPNDRIGWRGVVELTNGNYVVASNLWANGVGAVTWVNGTTGLIDSVNTGNSIRGTATTHNVGFGGVKALANGHYVINSAYWDNGGTQNVGAITWADGTQSTSGTVSAANSLIGSTAGDNIGFNNSAGMPSIYPLTNGHYVVASPDWDNPAAWPSVTVNTGAVTWGNGTTGTVGTISAANSLIGTRDQDRVGSYPVVPLTNGHYVVAAPDWDSWTTTIVFDAGAVTWGNGTTGVTGEISAVNSLVGTKSFDHVGGNGVTALNNGHYVASSSAWDNGAIVNAGAVTWGNGTTGTVGAVSSSNSLVGSTANDNVGGWTGVSYGVKALTNGHYVVASPSWSDGAIVDAGAVTWANGTTGITGTISPSNSLVSTTSSSQLGYGSVYALPNGQYAVASHLWDDGLTEDMGAVTWGGAGPAGRTGVVGTTNSLVGTTFGDQVGNGGVMGGSGVVALSNGHYLVVSPYWDNANTSTTDVGAVTYVNPSGEEPDPEPLLKVELSAATGSMAEGNSATSPVTDITLLVSGGISETARAVNLALTNGTATLANNDYSQTSLSITIPAGSYLTPVPISIPVAVLGIVGDASQEQNETFTMTLQNPSADLEIADANGNGTTISSAVYTITNDDIPAGVVTIADVSLVEGNAGTTTMTFVATLTGTVPGGFVVTTGIASGTATSDNDYSFTPVTLIFSGANGETRDFTVTIHGDTTYEPNETFTVSLNTPSKETVDISDTATGTITNDDAQPTGTVTIADVSVAEGNEGTKTMTFTASLAGSVIGGFTVDTALTTGTANASDYAFTPSTLSFNGTNGETKTFTVTINGDTLVEPNETFTVSLANASSTSVSITDTAVGTITNDDTAAITIENVTDVEGNVGNSLMTFTATLNADVAGGLTVNTAVANGTASSSSDYAFTPSTLTFAGTAGETKSFSVTVVGDALVEPNETFTVSLNTASNTLVNITDTAVGTINNDDSASVTIADVSMAEGNTGTSAMTFTVTLNGAVAGGFTVNSVLTEGTATPGTDYSFTPSTLTFNGTNGETQTFTVMILGDAQVEPNETFTVSVNAASKPSIVVSDTALGTITNDDTASLSIADVTVVEGNGGTTTMTFTATLSGAVPGGFTVNTAASNGGAIAPFDYTFSSTTLTFVGVNGEAKTFSATINGDTEVESDEIFTVSLTNSSNASVTITDTAFGTITNDDAATVTIADVSATEGNSGTTTMTFTATLAGNVAGGFTVNTAVNNGTALSGSDYSFTSSTLTFAGTNGETKTFTVTINGDTTVEANETFIVSLTNVSNASVVIGDTAAGTITNDDVATGTLTIADMAVTEGNAGPTTMTFTVTLAGAVGGFTVNTGIADGTATAGSDYSFTPSTLTFAGTNGETKTFIVTVNGDTTVEPNETFTVSLNTVSNASISIIDTALGTINNDDVTPPFFTWAPLAAIANTTLVYELEVATAATFTPASIVATATTTQTSLADISALPLTDGVKYWRVRGKYTVVANSAVFYSPYSATYSFTIDTVAPPAPALTEPVNTALITTTRTPIFKWGASVGSTRYRLEIDTNANFTTVELSFTPATSPFTLPAANALSNGVYAWRVVAIDGAGNETVSAVRTFRIALP